MRKLIVDEAEPTGAFEEVVLHFVHLSVKDLYLQFSQKLMSEKSKYEDLAQIINVRAMNMLKNYKQQKEKFKKQQKKLSQNYHQRKGIG